MSHIVAKIVIGLQQTFKNDYIVTFIISMLPTIETRGAIPIALQMGIRPVIAYFFSCISALVIVPILMVFLKPLLELLKRTKIFKSLAHAFNDMFQTQAKQVEDRAEKRAETRHSKKLDLYKMLGLFAFVALPLPLTGVWTGTAIAIFLNMDLKKSLLPLILGNFVAGAIVITISLLLGERSYIIILILLAFALIALIAFIIKLYTKLKQSQKADRGTEIIYSDKEEDR